MRAFQGSRALQPRRPTEVWRSAAGAVRGRRVLGGDLGTPADESTRLIYAHWLEEQADPRGTYLRAEADAFRSAAGDLSAVGGGLAQLAHGLDPVWVARVTRPPVGVCCAGVCFVDFPGRPKPRLGPAAFALLGRWLGPDWPPAYRAFLLNYNGGKPEPRRLELRGAQKKRGVAR
jgi:uncharacterized protein (TIGR02996 family)